MVKYLCAHIISATIKSILLMSSAIVLARLVFNLNVLSIGLFPVIFTYLNMVIFATAVGLVLLGLIFKRGTRIQALAWGSIYIIQPLCAVFFPVSVLPVFLQPISYAFPITYFFEWIRAIHTGGSVQRVKSSRCLHLQYFVFDSLCLRFFTPISIVKTYRPISAQRFIKPD